MNSINLAAAIRSAACTQAQDLGTNGVCCSYRFFEDFPGFRGHFPGSPILPAIVQIEMARLLVEEFLDSPLRLLAADHAKFLRPVRPGELLLLECRILSRNEKIDCDVRLTCDNQPVAGFRLTIGDARQ